MKYLYESHVGGLYSSDHERNHVELWCDMCCDMDCHVGQFESIADFWNLIKDKCDINGSGDWSLQYIYPYIIEEFNLIDDAEYKNYYEKDCGFCCNTEEWILNRINDLVKENSHVCM